MKKFINTIIKKKFIRVILISLLSLILVFTIFAIITPRQVIDNNPFIVNSDKGPLIAAHRGGKNLNPENTFLAFDYAIENYDIDILELDLCMTKDNNLVAVHDLTINRSSDVEEVTNSKEDYYVADHTLEELLQFNYGAKFVDKDNNMPYQNLVEVNQLNRVEVIKESKLNIVTIDEIFDAYYDTDLMFIVEIKNDGELGQVAADILSDLINDNNKYPNSKLINRVVIGTFHDDVEVYLKNEYPDLMRGGSVGEVTKFVLTQMVGLNIFDDSTFVCLQIPVQQNAYGVKFKLDKKTYVNRAHRRNISVQYWTINDEETMRSLIELGADVIMTDNPDLLYNILEEMGYR